jgi:predicted ribosomally synthesized peptide with SipW-like signal peptide
MIGSFRRIAVTGALGIAGLGLVGTGAHAVFTASATSTQQITTGTPGLSLVSSLDPSCTTEADKCGAITLPDVGPLGSTFMEGPYDITAYNTGTIPITESSLVGAVTYPSSPLSNQVWVCVTQDGSEIGYQSLSSATYPLLTQTSLAPGASDSFDVYLAAGESNPCTGPQNGDYVPAALTQAAADESVQYTLTLNGTA